MKDARGFTLLEMIVATVIMAVAIVGLLSGISGAVRNASRLTAYDRAVQLARWRMNELLIDDKTPRNVELDGAFDREQSSGVDTGWRARITTFELPPHPSPGQVSLDRVELEVWWTSGKERRTFTLDAFRPHVLKPEDLAPGGNP